MTDNRAYTEALERKLDFERQWLEQRRRELGPMPASLRGTDAARSWGKLGNEYFERAEVFYVSHDIGKLIGEAAKKLHENHVRLYKEMLPSSCGFVWFAAAHVFEFYGADQSRPVFTINLHGFEWMVAHEASLEEELFVIAITPGPNKRLREVPLFTWRWGRTGVTVEGVADHALNTAPAEMLAAALHLLLASFFLFVQQRILVPSGPQPVDRGTRRRAEKAGQVIHAGVRVIELRKRQRQDEVRQDEAHEVEWSCRWLVRGHWRQQLYPSRGMHQPLWIEPYVKGPEDKPVRLPRQQIFAVVR